MTCDICGPGDKAQTSATKVVGRDAAGRPVTCHELECRHAWHLVAGASVHPMECNCPGYLPPARPHSS
jgi:hypothetical protein